MATVLVDDLIDALDSVTWYEGLADFIIPWIDLEPNENGFIMRPDFIRGEAYEPCQMLWTICVSLFGDYGVAPRCGWIEDVEGFKEFLKAITKTEREARELDLL